MQLVPLAPDPVVFSESRAEVGFDLQHARVRLGEAPSTFFSFIVVTHFFRSLLSFFYFPAPAPATIPSAENHSTVIPAPRANKLAKELRP